MDTENTNQNEIINDPPKANRKPIIILSIITALTTIAAVIFACLYFLKPATSDNNTAKNNQNTSNKTETPAKSPDAETAITDTYILRDLDKKVAALFRTSDTSASRKTRIGGYYDYLELFHNGTLNEAAKVASVIDTMSDQFRPLSSAEADAAWSFFNFSGPNEDLYRQAITKGINGETVAVSYKDMFGSELSRQAYDGCYYYPYIDTYDFYFEQPFGCGGTSPLDGYYYKYNYTTDDKRAYVYMATATFDAENEVVYCDIVTAPVAPQDENYAYPPVCIENADYHTLESLNATNYQDYAKYRFVFNLADDGTYYFSHVEKIEE